MKKSAFVILTVLASAFAAAACGKLSTSAVESGGAIVPHTIVHLAPGETPSATDTPTETPTGTPDQTPTGTPDVTPTPDMSPTPTPDVSPTPTPDVSPTPTPDVSPTPTPDMSPTPTPNVSPTPMPTPCPGDIDCDGIPDPVDNIPCDGFRLKITNVGVSSATIEFNGTVVASSNDFPSTAEIDVQLNPVTGTNTLSLGGKVAGSPSDSFRFVIVDSLGDIYLDQTITRTSGAPHAVTIPVSINVTCQ